MAEKIGSKFVSVTSDSNVVTKLIDPATNTTGVTIRTATMHMGQGYSLLFSGTAAPGNVRGVANPVVLSCRGGANASSNFVAGAAVTLPYPIAIPAGQGLWFAKTSTSDEAGVYLTYDVGA